MCLQKVRNELVPLWMNNPAHQNEKVSTAVYVYVYMYIYFM